jgi:CIC family chloride channel protein
VAEAGVILAIELLLFEFKSRSFIPLVIASALATTVHVRLLGPGPMFQVGALDFGIPHALPAYLVLGGLCGIAAIGFSKALYWTEDQFEKLPIHDMWWPAIGALGLGIIGYFVPRVLGVGYDTISDILNAKMLLGGLLAVMVFNLSEIAIQLPVTYHPLGNRLLRQVIRPLARPVDRPSSPAVPEHKPRLPLPAPILLV